MTETDHRILSHFDAKRRTRQRQRASARINTSKECPILWREAAEGLADRLTPVARRFHKGLYISLQASEWSGYADSWQRGYFDETETLQAEGQFDLIISSLELHAINDLPGALTQIRRHLAPNGLFLSALFGGETLCELRTSLASGETLTNGSAIRRIPPFAEVPDLGILLQRAHFTMPIADAERTTVRYSTLGRLIADIRDMGENAPLATAPITRTAWAATQAIYGSHFSADGRFLATFDIVYLTGWAPQTKPLHSQPPNPRKPQNTTKIRTTKKPTN